jgi:hypothetical protein
MSNALAVLKRIRKHRKKGAEHAFMEAERAREIQADRVVEIEQAVATSRDNSEPNDAACWVAQEAAWRMKMEVRLRTEKNRLSEIEGVSMDRQRKLAHASREHRVVERIIEINDERRKIEDRKQETRSLDAMGTARWHRKEAK